MRVHGAYGDGMGNHGAGRRAAGRKVAVACACLLLLPLAGCAEAATSAPTSSPPTPTPVFASDEEALAAATAAYAGYVETADQIINEGGIEPERIERYATGDLAESEIESYRSFAREGLHGTGQSTFSNMSIQSLGTGSDGTEDVLTAYVCSDVSATDIVDSSGISTLASKSNPRTPFLVVFDLSSLIPLRLKVSSATVWNGEGVCA